jgi:hypothetical protein
MANLLEPNEIFFTSFEPKTKNRFIMYIDGIPSYIIKAAKRPSVTLNTNVVEHININRKLKGGKTDWEDIDITLYDPIVPSGAQAVIEWIRLSHESVSGRDGYSDFYKKDITISVVGPVGDKVEEWTLKGAFVNKADFGDLDWEEGGIQTISVTLSMDYAILEF